MVASAILLLRHAEKPSSSTGGKGLMPDGAEDEKSLTVRGWQRAGALAALLAPNRLSNAVLPTPDRIYASAFREGGGHSRRPEQTVEPLAQRLNCRVDLTWALHQEEVFAAALTAQAGTALVCWQHQGLAALARAIAGPKCLPLNWNWPTDRYDVIWLLQRAKPDGAWQFMQYCQNLLSGDSEQPFKV